MKFNGLAVASAMALVLAGCGGSGSGGVVSTPTPTPAAVNTTMNDLKVSQSFTNDAANLNADWDLATKTGIQGSAARSSLTVSYDARANSYTVSTGGASQTFTPADISSQDEYDTIYKVGGQLLTLTTKTYSKGLQTQYVAMGLLQRNSTANSVQNADLTSFTYGLPTSTEAVPRIGSAAYNIDTFGTVTAPGKEPKAFQGGGQFSIDFGLGIFSTHSYLNENGLVSGSSITGGGLELTAKGHLSSDATFSGNAIYEGQDGYAAGTINGRFYGPEGQELGATVSGENQSGLSFAGSMIGIRDSSLTPVNQALTHITHEQLFYTKSGTGFGGQLTWQNSETFRFSPPTSDMFGGQFTINDKVTSSDPNFTAYRKTFSNSYQSQDVTVTMYKPGGQNTELPLTYASFGRWMTYLPVGTGVNRIDHYFYYGFETPDMLLAAKTGTGHYEGVVYATATNGSAGNRYDVTGNSMFNVDFSANAFSGALTMAGTEVTSGAQLDFGSYDFSGTMGGYNATMQGNFSKGGSALGASSITGRFFGPDGEEIGAGFYLNDTTGAAGPGTNISGVTAAVRK